MMIFRNIIDCKSLESSQDNLYNGVYFSKVASPQCIDCNLSINRICHIFFSEYVPKNTCLRNNTLRKHICEVYQCFNKVIALYFTARNLTKNGTYVASF